MDCDFSSLELPARTTICDQGQEISSEAGPMLRWDCRQDARRKVLLAIHYDTVFGPDNSFQRCKLLDGGRLNGPGTADAKGGIMVILNALQAFEQFCSAKDVGWTVLLNPDEEIGSPSSAGYFQEVAQGFDFGLLFEPALPTGELVAERKGSGNFDLVVKGRSAHAGRHFEDGRNALTALCTAMLELDKLNTIRDGLTVNIGNIVGGGPVNVVPDTAVGRINVRMNDQESANWFQDQLKEIVDKASQREGIQAAYHGKVASPPKSLTPQMQNLMSAIQTCTREVNGSDVNWRSTGGVCDGNKLAAAGLPNIDTLGPCGDGLHSSHEWVQVNSIPQKAMVIVRLLESFAAGRFPELERNRDI